MTISITDGRIDYAGNGSTTTFAIDFDFDVDADIKVTLITDSTNNAVLQTNPTEYDVVGTDVEMVTAPASGETLVIELAPPLSQADNYIEDSELPAETLEDSLDALAKQVKSLQRQIDFECMKLPTNTLDSTTVTDTDIVALKILRVNATADGLELATVNAITNGGDEWGDEVDADIIPDTDNTYDLGSATRLFAEVRATSLYGTLQTAAQTNITSLGTLTALNVDNLNLDGNTISASSGNLLLGSSDLIDMGSNTGALGVPIGTTAQRDISLGAGALRWNSTDNKLEAYSGSTWVQYSAAGGPGDWSDAVDADIIPDTDSTYDIGAVGSEFAEIHGDSLYGTLQTAAQTNITSLGTLTTLTVDNITINGNTLSTSSGNIESSEILDLSGGTSHLLLPTGTTAQRVGTTAGELRYNSTTSQMEYYNGSSWEGLQESSSGGSAILLATETVSGGTELDFTSSIDSTYDSYWFAVEGVTVGTDGAYMRCQISTDGGSTYESGASDYSWSNATRQGVYSDAAASYISIVPNQMGNDANGHWSGNVYLRMPADTNFRTTLDWQTGFNTTSNDQSYAEGSGAYMSATAVDGIKFYASTGTVSGTIRMYGIKQS